ncbi:hypothetical protein GOP47_0018990 [Adiantum capillus-veneris]|uniref:Uncharacterized protein n=1 Tax=Adiantum capillus-veneris TaxID=13818 RepID=A0A9D4UEA0_ADICA|nr:hypothetical protein GOP47_0018990 [Adiantum capillus-veneris]
MCLNIPLAIIVLGAVGYLSYDLEVRQRIDAQHVPSHLAHLLKHQLSSDDSILHPPPLSTKWRRKIDSPVVEASVDEFTRCIVQEFVTDLWFASLSPDQDVPQQIQALINEMFGEIGQRVKRINLISLMTRDLVDLVGNHIELFRQTKAGVKHFETLSTEAREENLKLVLRKANKLHPALLSSDSECKVLQQLMSGVVAILLRPQDAQCALLRGLARELLACAVLRPVMNFASPGFINKAIEQATSSAKEKSQLNKSEKGPGDGSSVGKSSKGENSRLLKVAENESKAEHGRESSRVAMSSTESLGKQDDWAQILEAVSKRRTTTLAPENLDNLWTKGRNYKKKDLERASVKPSQTAIVSGPSRTSSEIPHRLAAEKYSIRPTGKRSTGFSNYDLESGFDAKSRTKLSDLSKADKPVLLHGHGLSHDDEGLYGSETLSGKRRPRNMVTADTAYEQEKLLEEPLGIELHYPQTKNSSSGTDGWQKPQKSAFNQDGSLNYWDNPGIQLSTGSSRHDNVADWLNDTEGLGGQNMAQSAVCKLNCWVVGAHLEKISSKTFAVYSIAVTDSDNNTWFVERRFRNFEQLHRNLRDLPQYNLQLPPKRILSSSLDDAFVRDRCILLDKYLKDLLSIPSIAEMHEVWDFLSVTSKKYAFAKSSSVMKTIAVNVDDAVDDMFRQLKGVSDGLFRQLGAPSPPREEGSTIDPFRRTASSEASSVGYQIHMERERLEQLSDDESVGHPDEESSFLLEGWHSDSELQLPDSRTNAPSHLMEFDKDMEGTKKRIKRVGSDLLPGESVAGLEAVDDDLGVPPEWSPPKVTLPLLNLVDGVFQLQRRGWLRRQVFWMAKQILQVGMGDAVDDWLVTKVRWLRREDVVASSLKWIQEILWPGGVFITKIKKDDSATAFNSPSGQAAKPSLQSRLDQSAFFESQLEASRCAHVVHEVLVEGGPAALVSLVGRKQYTKCAKDIYYFLQSTIFLKQLTYSVLETLLAATFPELTRLIIDIRRGKGQVVI